MKKFAVILAGLTFVAGCARQDGTDMTETETGTGYGTPAAGEMGTETGWETTPPPATNQPLGTVTELEAIPQGGTQSPAMPDGTAPITSEPGSIQSQPGSTDNPPGSTQDQPGDNQSDSIETIEGERLGEGRLGQPPAVE